MHTDLFLAVKFVREGRAQSLLLVTAAAIGITVVFFLTALVVAVERTMIAQTLDVLPHIVVRRPDAVAKPSITTPGAGIIEEQVYPPEQRVRSIENWPVVFAELEGLGGVSAVSPVASGPGVATRGAARRSVTVLGVEPDRFSAVITVRPRLRAGTLDLVGSEAVIGTELAADLGVEVGDRIRISTGDGARDAFRVVGVFDLGNRDVNERWLLIPLRRAQALLDLPGGVSTLNIRVSDIWNAATLARRIEMLTGLTAESWTETNAQLSVAIQSQRGATLMIRVFVMVAVAMGVASVLVVSTVQKGKQIGILRAMGLSRGAVQRIFLAQGVLVGLTGAVIGCGAGTALALLFEASARNPDGTATYPIELPLSLYLLCLCVAVATGLIAALLPARRAASLDPAVAIRYE